MFSLNWIRRREVANGDSVDSEKIAGKKRK